MNVTHAHAHPEPYGYSQATPAFATAGYDGTAGYGAEGYAAEGYPAPTVYAVREPNAFTRFFLRLYERSPKWAAPLAIAACFGGTAAYVLVSNPTDAGAADPPTCLIKLTTGLDCPGCGGTRAFYYLLRGNIPEAARHHIMAVFAAPFLIWLYVAWSVQQTTGRRIPAPKITARTISFFMAAWGIFMIARNLPFAPFTYLFV